jgi:signal transduction histidine kinase
VAGIAHEINNPLGIIAGYSEALLDRSRDPGLSGLASFEDFPEYLETINKEIFRCKDILRSLLDFAKPSGGTFREIDINELIKEVILLVKHGAKKQNHVIRLELDREIPRTAADPGALRQLFINIIMNSFYFMGDEGTLVIRTASEPGEFDGESILISISDNGKGIERDIVDSIFDPFFTTKPAGEGTGLGLSICHRIVTEHDGTIDIDSEPGKGTTFNIRLPVRSA